MTTTWAMTTWANRASASYVSIDKAINGKYVDAYGRLMEHPSKGTDVPRRVYKSENGTTAYAMYEDDSTGNVPVASSRNIRSRT